MALSVSKENRDPAIAARNRMRRAHLQDGIPEMVIGIMLLLCAGSFWMPDFAGQRWIGAAVEFTFRVAFVVLCLSMSRIVRWIRDRYLLARVGYVEASLTGLERQRKRRALMVGLVMVIAIVGVALVVRPTYLDGRILAGNGILFALLTLFVTDNRRFWLYGVVTATFGVWLSSVGLPVVKGLSFFYSSVGILYLISGAVVLFLFVRKPAEDAGA